MESESIGIRRDFLTRIRESYLLAYLARHPLYAFGFTVMGISLLLAIIGPYIVPHSPTTGFPGDQLLSPSSKYWFGTDVNAMDIFSIQNL